MFNKVKGMNDILPEKDNIYKFILKQIIEIFNKYNFLKIETPIIEKTDLFINCLKFTDIIEKEMYSFIDSLNNNSLTLRPENTLGIMRSVIENNLIYNKIQKLWYYGPMFRHEKPQKNRYRQFNQIGIEILGINNLFINIEIILISYNILCKLRLKNLILIINNIGNLEERYFFKKELIFFLKKNIKYFNNILLDKILLNPLKILDSKNKSILKIINFAPKILNFLTNESKNNFNFIVKILNYYKLPFKINKNLVRGLNYYNNIIFEWVNNIEKITICGGGRYDFLSYKFINKNIPSCGFAFGLERLYNILYKDCNFFFNKKFNNKIYIIYENDIKFFTINFVQKLRKIGLNIIFNYNTKKQLKDIKNYNIRYIIFLKKILLNKNIIKLRDLKFKKNIYLKLNNIKRYFFNLLI